MSYKAWFDAIYLPMVDDSNFDLVAYGMPNWPSRSYWIVPGTIEE